ncbi:MULTISPECIES: ArsR/SmtB family transcription factor [Pontibacillus]|uniref:Metalloregulator ArsR/SmtB family transcription factor n=1 Tax=Pontibacillus chungwhensis TaxID=265426 RepID=A0ABY8UVN8_9BACI|nr:MULTISPECIES: metalloregulator ArsR/SmtB family transcription factor [Pontibacillus]MCD5323101.1 metalloregulator ArsR/SmtB family transcription factor [Pontibacillus sp. HN14]WIF96490.1 metalloregulator ArsR/SmtB family transcription factor [Pontibacillus chungwhensis]
MSTHFEQLFRLNTLTFHALGDTARQDIILLLDQFKRLSVNEIAEKSPLSRPAVSHHLKILRDAGIVSIEKEGTKRYYFLTIEDRIDLLKQLITEVEKHCIE